jgi:hypothetical protein
VSSQSCYNLATLLSMCKALYNFVLPIPPAPLPNGKGDFGEIRDMWVRSTHISLISPLIPRPMGGGERGGGIFIENFKVLAPSKEDE